MNGVSPNKNKEREVRWGTKSIYEADPQLDPFGSSSKVIGEGSKSPEAAPQFQLRF